MATELAKAYVQIIPSAKGIKGGLEDVMNPAASSAGRTAGSRIGSGIKAAIIAAGIGAAIKQAVMQGADLQQSIGGIETLFKDAAGTIIASANGAFRTAGLSANAYMETVTQSAAAMINSLEGDTAAAARYSDMMITDMADNANKMGTSMQSLQDAYRGFSRGNFTMLDNLALGFSGTKAGMQDLLDAAKELSGVEYDIESYSDIVQAIHVIQQDMGITGATAAEAANTITGSFNAMKAALQNVLGALTLGQDITPALEGLKETVITFVGKNLAPAIVNIIKDLPRILIDAVTSLAPQLLITGVVAAKNIIQGMADGINDGAQVTAMIEQIGRTIETGMPMIGQSVADLVSQVAAVAPDILLSVVDQIPYILNGIVNTIKVAGPQIFSAAVQLFLGLIEALPVVLEQLLPEVSNLISKLGGFLKENTPLIFEAAVMLLGAIIDSLGPIAEALLENLPTIIATILDVLLDPESIQMILDGTIQLLTAIIAALPTILKLLLVETPKIVSTIVTTLLSKTGDILRAAVQLLKGILTAFGEMLKELKVQTPSIVQTIKDGIKSGIDSITAIGKNIVQGLWNGISGAGSWLWSKVRSFARNILTQMKSALGIHSPSTLTAYQGKMLDLGLAKGIEGNMRPIQNAIDDVTRMTTNAFTSEMAFSTALGMPEATASTQLMLLIDLVDEIVKLLQEMGIYIDGDKLVGALSQKFNQKLGQTQDLTARGVTA